MELEEFLRRGIEASKELRQDISYISVSAKERKVALYKGEGGLYVSTARVNDGFQPFETAVRHPDYNDGEWIIVEPYPERALAVAGHERWVATMTREPLPDQLADIGNNKLSRLLKEASPADMVFPRRRSNESATE